MFTVSKPTIQLCYPDLPLMVYREIAAHLQQVESVTVKLLPQSSQEFSYQHSQIEGLEVTGDRDINPHYPQQVEQICEFYAQKYGRWQTLTPPVA
ncbi:hypothetical protein PN462_06705 [Spirulina sp. CS-785/01]|uniref:hypothetical protein n=1 Tax=Spirulina sp. CS-785/01 TaxID=3021716 RepID=UPI00232DA369|nr:hypothetical protein [Spirulina sp. CS-785/01]MDB9312785.1 hypothetical protein [Spirulina sp. CS-785/01]